MPRSGSTPLSNIIGQNPAFHLTFTSGPLDLLWVARAQFTSGEEFKAQEPGTMERTFAGFCRGRLEGYASSLTENPGCSTKAGAEESTPAFWRPFYADPKIVCMVRDPMEFIYSMERKFRQVVLHDPGVANHSELGITTLEKQLNHWVTSPPVAPHVSQARQVLGHELCHWIRQRYAWHHECFSN